MVNGISWGMRPVQFAGSKKTAAKPLSPEAKAMQAKMKSLNLTPPYGFDPGVHYVGEKFQPRLDLAEVARQIRGDIQDAINTGVLPPRMKTSVTIDRRGKSIDVSIKDIPGWQLVTSESLRRPPEARITTVSSWGNGSMNNPGVTKETLTMLETLAKMVKAYNYDRGDSQYDYSASNFYERVGLDQEYLDRELKKARK